MTTPDAPREAAAHGMCWSVANLPGQWAGPIPLEADGPADKPSP